MPTRFGAMLLQVTPPRSVPSQASGGVLEPSPHRVIGGGGGAPSGLNDAQRTYAAAFTLSSRFLSMSSGAITNTKPAVDPGVDDQNVSCGVFGMRPTVQGTLRTGALSCSISGYVGKRQLLPVSVSCRQYSCACA